MTAPNTTNNVTVRKLADVAEGMWNKSKNAFVNASGDTMTGRLTMEKVPINQIVTGTGTAATSSSSGGTTTYYPAKWNFDLGIATPSAGDQLVIKIPVAGHDYGVWISTDNGITYFPVARNYGTSRLTTHYPNGAYICVVFETYIASNTNSGAVNDVYPVAGGTSRINPRIGCWRVLNDYDSDNTYDRLYTANGRFRTGSTGCFPYSLVCLDNTQSYSMLVTSNSGTGTNKAINTDGKFVYPASILYYAANNTVGAGTIVASTYNTYIAYPSLDIRYSSNHTVTFTTNKPVYIECTLNGDGTWSPTSNSITQTLRTGYYYIFLGIAYSTEYQVSLAPEHPLYYYDGTNLVSAEVARGDITAGTNNGELKVAGTDITVYTHPTDAGNKHIPAGGSSGQFLGYDSDGTAKWVSNPNTDTKVKATAKTDNANYKILATASASPTSGAATEAVYDTDITLNPSTNTISANVSGTAASAGKLTTARTTYVTLGTASTSTTRDWSGTTTIPVSGTLGLGNGGTGATSAAGARTNLDVYSKSETESLLNGKVVIVTVLPATGEAGKTYYVKDTSATGVDKYDEYIWAVDAGATTESWIHVGEKSLDLSEYVNALTTSGTGPLVKSLSKSGNTLTATLGTIAIDNLSDWASSTDVTVSSVTYHTWWPVAPTSSNQVYGLSIYNGRLYRVYNNKGTYSVQNYDANTTYTNKSLGQGYGTCATEAATAAKIVTMSEYALTTGGIVTVNFTNALCTSATMNINGTGAKPIYIKGAAVTANNAATVSAGDTAYFMYDGTAYHLLGTDRAATNPIVNISRSGTTFTATRLDGTTFTFTQQDNNTTYTQAKLGQGYGTCTTAEATAAKSVTLTGYELEPNGVVAVKFTNGLCASATMSINGKTATPIYINGAAVTSTSCKEVLAGDIAFFIYDGSHYQFICTDRISKNGITGLSISGKTITYTRADGSTGTLTTQDTTYTFDGVYNSSSNKAATVSTVTNAVNALDVDDITGFGAGKTLATLTETDGKIAATFQNISITKSQVSDFSHAHGNITNGGALQTTDVTIASGDKLVITDSSDSNKVARASAAFDGTTTTKALTQKGTFESFVSSINKNGSTITPSSGVANIGYMPVTEAQATATVQEVIQALRVKPGGRMGSVLLNASTVSSTSIPSAWYNYIWIPHRTGSPNDDNQNFGTLILTPMTSTPDVYVIEGSDLNASSPTYRIKRLDAVTAEDAIATGDKLLFSDDSDSSKTKRMNDEFDTTVSDTFLCRNGNFATVKEADVRWGGSFRQELSPIEFGNMCRNVIHNPPPAAIKFEKTTDGGTTWTEQTVTDNAKMQLCNLTLGSNFSILNSEYSGVSSPNMLKARITLTAMENFAVTSYSNTWFYAQCKRIVVYCSKSGNSQMKIETQSGPNFIAHNDTWTDRGTYAIAGDSGWNSIPFDMVVGGYGDQVSNRPVAIRFTYWIESGSTPRITISRIGIIPQIHWTSRAGNIPFLGVPIDIENNGAGTIAKASKLSNARELSVDLSSTSTTATSFDGTANVSIKNTGTLPVSKGGTGKTSVTAAEYNLLSHMGTELTGEMNNDRLFAFAYGTQNETNGRLAGYRKASTVWSWIKDKLASDTNVDISGHADSATHDGNGNTISDNSVYYVVGTTDYPAWQASHAYAINDYAISGGKAYYCKTAHTSGSSFDSSKWTAVATPIIKGTVSNVTALFAGMKIALKWPITGGSSSTYLNINNLGNVYIRRNDGNTTTHVPANTVTFLAYDGTYWRWSDYDSNSTYSGMVTAYLNNAGDAAKSASSTNFRLTDGITIILTNNAANTKAAALTLNVNSTGAKALYINGNISSSTNYTIPIGTYFCHYKVVNGTGQWHLWTDGTAHFTKLHLDTPLPDAEIASAATWNAKQDAITYMTVAQENELISELGEL